MSMLKDEWDKEAIKRMEKKPGQTNKAFAKRKEKQREKLSKANVLMTTVLLNNHNDLLMHANGCPYLAFKMLKARFGIYSEDDDEQLKQTSVSKQLNIFQGLRLNEEGDIAKNVHALMEQIESIAVATNSIYPNNPPITDVMKFHHLQNNVGPLTEFIAQAIISMENRTYARLCCVIDELLNNKVVLSKYVRNPASMLPQGSAPMAPTAPVPSVSAPAATNADTTGHGVANMADRKSVV